jgi:hypothetical protein
MLQPQELLSSGVLQRPEGNRGATLHEERAWHSLHSEDGLKFVE